MRHPLAAALLLAAAPAAAQDVEPRFCPNRPDLGASGCTTRPGDIQFELSGIDWERDDDAGAREDRIGFGDLLVRAGIGPRTEVQLGWTPLARVRTRDRSVGTVETITGSGDVRLGLRQNLRNPDGSGFSWGLEPFVTLPVGRDGIGDGDWSAGLVLPATYDLGGKWEIAVTSTAQAAVDADGDGRHFAVDSVVGLGRQLGEAWTIVGEISVERDHDPAGTETRVLAAGSAAWHPAKHWQLDLLVVAGLSHDAPDVRLVTGGAILF